MSLYAQYVKEREGFDTVETEYGFGSYKCTGEECYLRDIYVVPEKRETRVGADIADAVSLIAKEKGCKYLIGTVSPLDKNSTKNTTVLIRYGMKILRSSNDLIYFIKEL